MAAEPARGRQISCPDCGGPVRPDRERLCPRCGYPLMFLEDEPQVDAPVVARAPGERDDSTDVFPRQRTPADTAQWPAGGASPDAGGPAPGELACPWCRERNPQTRIRCQRCGRELRAPQPAPPPPPLPPPPPAVKRSTVAPIVISVVTAAALAAAAAVGYFLVRGGSGDDTGSPPASQPAPVVPDRITVAASSVQPDRPEFAAAHLTDGDAATTWQSDADHLKTNVGVRLTFRFDKPVRLARVTLVNGDGRSTDNYRNNERVAKLSVTTAAGKTDWSLPDSGEPQTLELDGTATPTVTIVVDATYPGARFRDLAISEVSFAELP